VTSNHGQVSIGLPKLKAVLQTWAEGRQRHKIVYDNTWGGLVTSHAYHANDIRLDYGNVLYNDHHFHYGYWVYAAAVLADLEPDYFDSREGQVVKSWVTSLIRDFANPVENDSFFPMSRAFDWYHGHSWATGLDALMDGKNEESTSEDAFSMYAVKLWGHAIGDKTMEARSNLQLAILRRSLRSYFLMESGNKNQPGRFIANNVPGIVSRASSHCSD
jgi:endo-1,3(4)-beta-glucanase